MTLHEWLTALLLLIGTFFMVVAGLGVVRMPDLLLRTSTTSKTSTLGAGSILLAVAVYFWDFGTLSRALATIIFLFLTAPIAAHMICRAAYFVGVPLWERTQRDEMREHYAEDHPSSEA